MEIIVGKFYTRKEINDLELYLKENLLPSSFTYGFGIDQLMYYKIGDYEFKETKSSQNSDSFCCIVTPTSSLDQEKEHHFTTSLHRPESKKTANYYKRWDNHSREARKLQSKKS